MYGQQNCPPIEPAASREPSVARSRGLASRRLFWGLMNPRVGIAQFSTVFVPLLSERDPNYRAVDSLACLLSWRDTDLPCR